MGRAPANNGIALAFNLEEVSVRDIRFDRPSPTSKAPQKNVTFATHAYCLSLLTRQAGDLGQL